MSNNFPCVHYTLLTYPFLLSYNYSKDSGDLKAILDNRASKKQEREEGREEEGRE